MMVACVEDINNTTTPPPPPNKVCVKYIINILYNEDLAA